MPVLNCDMLDDQCLPLVYGLTTIRGKERGSKFLATSDALNKIATLGCPKRRAYYVIVEGSDFSKEVAQTITTSDANEFFMNGVSRPSNEKL